eukprot:8250120-Karenia_brevis.AAC.1
MLDDEACDGSGFVSGTSVIDLAKAYEHIGLNLLWLLSVFWQCPLDLVALALEAYSAPRALKVGQAHSRLVQTSKGLPAGSKYANRFLKVILILPMDLLLSRWPRLSITMYVDDIT